jgi:tetratricopeptide (TPR) repeat protein
MTVSGAFSLSAERPFPGLRPFGSFDRHFFFGRSTQYFALYRLLNMSRFMAVIGNSGSGKSSLVRAGLQPLLEEEAAEPNGRQWAWAEMRPGDRPLEALATALSVLAQSVSPAGDGQISEMREARIGYLLRASSHGVSKAIAEMPEIGPTRPVVLLIDQFEELFRFVASGGSVTEDARQRDEAVNFVQLLLEASRSPTAEIHVVITMRSDFIGDCARFQGLPEAVSATQFLVPSMTRDQREEVIRGPVAKAGATIEAALVEELLNDSGVEMDQLPVLQHCLLRLWERAGQRSGKGRLRTLTPQDYHDIGSMAGALSQHAEEILTNDLKGQEPLVARVFRSLSDLDHDGRATRRAISFGQLEAETAIDGAELTKIIDRLRSDDCSFLTPSPSATTLLESWTRIDVGHEALLRHWERVSGVSGATGERGDDRQLGWLKEEHLAGQRYQVLRAMASVEGDDTPVLSSEQFNRYWPWWTERPRTPAWTERYGGGHDKVERLLKESRKAFIRTGRRERWAEITKAALGIAGVLLIAATVGAYFLWNEYRVTSVERDRANQLATTAFSSIETVARELRSGLTKGAVKAETARDMLGPIADRLLDINIDESPPRLIQTKAVVLTDLSDLFSIVGDRGKAQEQAEKALDLSDQLLAIDPKNLVYKRLVFSSAYRVGEAMLLQQTDAQTIATALAHYDVALAQANDLLAAEPDRVDRFVDLGFIRNKIGEAYQIKTDYPAARGQFLIALDWNKKVAEKKPDRVGLVASTEVKIADVVLRLSPPLIEEALDHYDNALAIHQRLYDNAPSSSTAASNLATTHRGRGDALVRRWRSGDFEAAVGEFQTGIDLFGVLLKRDGGDARWMLNLASLHYRMAGAYEKQGDLAKAIAYHTSELEYRKRLVLKDPNNKAWQDNLLETENKLTDLKAKVSVTSPK